MEGGSSKGGGGGREEGRNRGTGRGRRQLGHVEETEKDGWREGREGGKNGRIKVSKTVRISRLMCSREARICSTAVNSGCTPRGRSTNRTTRPQQ